MGGREGKREMGSSGDRKKIEGEEEIGCGNVKETRRRRVKHSTGAGGVNVGAG